MCYNQFVSLRRCELKSWMKNPLVRGRLCSSPCGDVNWNAKSTSCSSSGSRFVSLRRRELKCDRYFWRYFVYEFVSLRRRELKFSGTVLQTIRIRSFPQGNVIWNCSVFAQAKLDKSSSPRGDVNWNIFSGANSLGFFSSSPCGDVSWNTIWLRGHGNSNSSSPCGDASWNDDIKWNTTDEYRFVSSRRRELK